MKMTGVETEALGIAWRDLTFVRVLTDEGIEGVGEVRMLNHTDALLGSLAEGGPNHLIGHDPTEIEAVVRRMDGNDYARAGEIATRRERAAADLGPGWIGGGEQDRDEGRAYGDGIDEGGVDGGGGEEGGRRTDGVSRRGIGAGGGAIGGDVGDGAHGVLGMNRSW